MPASDGTALRAACAEHPRDAASERWRSAYGGMIERLPAYVRHARWTLCGVSVCIDAIVPLRSAAPLLDAAEPPPAVALAAELKRRAAAGIGGELRVDWDDGPAWLDARIASRSASGGTGPHAGRVLAELGAPALLALQNRSAEQLALIHPAIALAHGGRPTPARDVPPSGSRRPRVYIFEFTAGERVGRARLPRSTRIIVRFHDLDLEEDRAFAALGMELAVSGGSGVLAGLNGLGLALPAALAFARELGRGWRDAGMAVVHHELGGYERPQLRDRVLEDLTGTCTSFGMSLSEFAALEPGGGDDVAAGARRLAERLHADRVCVHADGWALTATRRDPRQEQDALLAGCLIAATRASLGRSAVPHAVPDAARFQPPPAAAPPDRDGWSIVTCAAPYLVEPQTTLGLGDSFMAGCLLVLGQPYPPGGAAAGTPVT